MRMRLLALSSVLVLVLDQLSKAAALAWLEEPVTLGPFALRLVYNEGIAFGALKSTGGALLFAVLALALILVLIWRAEPRSMPLYGLILGGGLANVSDRVTRGHVVDFIDIGRWPVFNLADTAITIGVILLFIMLLRERKETGDEPELSSPSDGD